VVFLSGKILKNVYVCSASREASIEAQLIISCMGSIAEMNRNQIKTRALEGIRVAQALGKFKGRKVGATQTDEKLLQRHQSICKKLQKVISISDITEITGTSSATICKVKKVMVSRKMLEAC
jgi:DNA invertase Pin-like site-specific DNA recombinase